MIPGCAPQPTAKRDKGSLGQSRRRVDVFCDQDAWTSLISPLNLWAHNLSSSTPEIFQHFSRKGMWTSQQADKAVDWSVYEAKTMNLTCNVFTVWRLETTTTNNFTLCPVVLEHLWQRRPTIQTEISTTNGWTAIQSCSDVHDPQRINLTGFDDPLTFPLVPPWV